MRYRRLITALLAISALPILWSEAGAALSELALDWGLKDVRQLEYG